MKASRPRSSSTKFFSLALSRGNWRAEASADEPNQPTPLLERAEEGRLAERLGSISFIFPAYEPEIFIEKAAMEKTTSLYFFTEPPRGGPGYFDGSRALTNARVVVFHDIVQHFSRFKGGPARNGGPPHFVFVASDAVLGTTRRGSRRVDDNSPFYAHAAAQTPATRFWLRFSGAEASPCSIDLRFGF